MNVRDIVWMGLGLGLNRDVGYEEIMCPSGMGDEGCGVRIESFMTH